MTINLDNLTVAAPCPANWDEMAGDERVRFCGDCKQNVYNLSDLSRAAAERLLIEKEGRLCVRFFRRADGTILTRNCPVGLRRVQRTVERVFAAVAAMFGVVVGASGCISAEYYGAPRFDNRAKPRQDERCMMQGAPGPAKPTAKRHATVDERSAVETVPATELRK